MEQLFNELSPMIHKYYLDMHADASNILSQHLKTSTSASLAVADIC